jgi:hypothetical protein
MSTSYTENYHLGKQENYEDEFNMGVITNNMDIIDSVIKSLSDVVDTLSHASGNYAEEIATINENISTLNELGVELSDATTVNSRDISNTNSSLESLARLVNKYAIPRTPDFPPIIKAHDISQFADGIIVGKFARSIWDIGNYSDGENDNVWDWGVAITYSLGDEGMGRYVTQFLWLPSVWGNGLMLVRNGYESLGNFRYCWSPDRYEVSISSSSMEEMTHGVWIGTVSTDITGAAEAMRGVARTYTYSNGIAYDLHYSGNSRMQIVETIDGTRKTRYYDNSAIGGGWTSWV